jgi:hypothetical protein
MTIERYLTDLRRRLPLLRRKRFLAETEAHLRDSVARYRAAGLDHDSAEAEALADFGGSDLVASRFAAEGAVVEMRVASLLALGAAAFFVFPLYVVPENVLPPAPWATKPGDILVLQIVAVSLWLTAVGLAAMAASLAWTPWPRLAATALIAVSVAIAGAGAVSAALVVRWSGETSFTADWPLLAAPLAVCSIGACALACAWARRRRELLRFEFTEERMRTSRG